MPMSKPLRAATLASPSSLVVLVPVPHLRMDCRDFQATYHFDVLFGLWTFTNHQTCFKTGTMTSRTTKNHFFMHFSHRHCLSLLKRRDKYGKMKGNYGISTDKNKTHERRPHKLPSFLYAGKRNAENMHSIRPFSFRNGKPGDFLVAQIITNYHE